MANLEKKLRTRIAQKWDLAENWVRSELQLLKGELAIDELNRIKIGNGVDKWRDLPFAVDGKSTAISFLNELPEANSSDFKPGNLVLTPDNKLWCLVATGTGDNAVRSWVDLTNKDDVDELKSDVADLKTDVEGIQTDVADLKTDVAEIKTDVSGIEGSIVALKEEMDANDAAHDAALVSIQSSTLAIENDLVAVKNNVAANRTSINAIYDAETGMINSSVLPSFVDDVVEGIVYINEGDATYNLTHNQSNNVIGFFRASGADAEGENRVLTLVTAETPADVNLSATSFSANGNTYTFAPVSEKVNPSSSIIYVDIKTNQTYRWSGSQFIVIASSLALGVGSGSAFYGDRGLALEKEVFGNVDNENPENSKTGLVDRTTSLETNLSAEIEVRANADSVETAARIAGDEENSAAIIALATECETKHKELQNEFAASIVALKEESERADAAHDASLVALQQQIDSINVTTSGMDINDVISNSEPAESGGYINNDILVFECGDSEAPALDNGD